MKHNKLLVALPLAVATLLSGCGGSGDAGEHVVRTIFAVGDIVEGVEDGDPIEGNVGDNDKGTGLSFALAAGSTPANGSLTFNADGSFSYTPNADFFGTDSVTYVATGSGGETDSAVLTFNVMNDFETIDEYGWQLAWGDNFEQAEVDTTLWQSENTSIVDNQLVVSGTGDMTAMLSSVASIASGRVEASIRIDSGNGADVNFAILPMTDLYDGDNLLSLVEVLKGKLAAGAHYGIGIVNGVQYNSAINDNAATEFYLYAVEWDASEIRWYVNNEHILTVDNLNTWGYNGTDSVTVSQDGPFNQDMKIGAHVAADASITIDYINVYSCDSSVAPAITNCASNVSRSIARQASDRIETVGPVTTTIFADGYFEDDQKVSDLTPAQWHHTDEIIEFGLSNWNSPTLQVRDLENQRGLVIEVTHPAGDANIGISAPGIELVGHQMMLNFDMYIDSAATTTETFDIRMETGWPYLGALVWNTSELQLDTWVSYSIPVSDFVDSPFIAPDWLNWIPGVGAGDPLPVDTANIGSLLTIEFHGAVHFQLDNISLTCVNAESCVQAPLNVQKETDAQAAPNTLYEAENWLAAGDVATEDTADDGGGQNVGWIDAGDFLEYTISAPMDGNYYVEYRLASQGGSDGFDFSIDGTVVDSQTVSDTGGWQNWSTQTSAEFFMTAGQHTARFDFAGGAINLNWFKVYEPVFEIFIEAEDYEAAGDVATEDTADEGGGLNVGWIDAGDFLEYTVNIPADGSYQIEYRLASQGGSDGFETSVGGVVVDTQTVPDTGGWQEWTSVKSTVNLVAGEQTLRVDFVGGAINVNWIKITNQTAVVAARQRAA